MTFALYDTDTGRTPRYPLAGTPYARRALSADSLGKFSADDYARLDNTQTFTGSNTFSGPVGVTGTATFASASTLALSGSMSVAASGVVSFASGARLYIDAGTAAAPGAAVQGDRNTGLFSPASDALSIATGGAERLRVNATGLRRDRPLRRPGRAARRRRQRPGDRGIPVCVAPNLLGRRAGNPLPTNREPL